MANFEFDVFLSHSSKDKPLARNLAKRLGSDGLRVWFDEWVINPGDLVGLKIEQGLERSRTLILVMSANAFSSEWMTLERHTALFRDPTNAQRRFIPVRIDEAPIPDTLRQFAYVDWRDQSSNEYDRLLLACRRPDLSKETGLETLESTSIEATTSAIGLSMTPDGMWAASGSRNGPIYLWDLTTQKSIRNLLGHREMVLGVAITDDRKLLVSGSYDRTVRTWDVESGKCTNILKGHSGEVIGVAVTPDGRRAISSSWDRTVKVWDLKNGVCVATLEGHTQPVIRVAITPDGKRALSGANDRTVRFWNLERLDCIGVLKGHTDGVIGVSLVPNATIGISGSEDGTVRVWDLASLKCTATLEGHTDAVRSVAITEDGHTAVSASFDKTVRIWDLASGTCTAVLTGHTKRVWGLAITANGRRVVSVSDDEQTLHIWDLPKVARAETDSLAIMRYTNAKVLLVGESGVGKTALAIRLVQQKYEITDSTDGTWASQMKLPEEIQGDQIEREIWLWDFAGQADYRLIHQLFMDETALAILVFNPQSEDPFDSLLHWDRDITKAARRPFRKLLVAGRCDRGGLMVSRRNIDRFKDDHRYMDYIETSALTGTGCQQLHEAIVKNIAWEEIPWTASPKIFRLLKAGILALKDEGKVLLRMSELRQQLEMRLAPEMFTTEQLRAVTALLAGPGIVWKLEFGDFVLLHPERINAYAAAVIRSVRAHSDEIGCITEERVLAGDIDFQDMKRLPGGEEQIVLRAMHQIFVKHGLCLREHTHAGNLLVFPSYFKRERPELEQHPAAFVSYYFIGALEEIYATLVVKLHHTPAFDRDQLWRFAADFRTQEGKRVGLKMKKLPDASGEITVYFEAGIPEDTKVTFIRYIHDHLSSKDPNVKRVRHYVCPHCNSPVENRNAIRERLARGKKDILCVSCEKRMPLDDLIERKFTSDDLKRKVLAMENAAVFKIDNESKELVLLGHAIAVAGEAGQIFRPTLMADWGIDGEIEFKDYKGQASGMRVYLQLKSGDSYLYSRQRDGAEVFTIKNERLLQYWQQHAYPVMLVIRSSDGVIRWMEISSYLRDRVDQEELSQQIIFDGEPFTALNVQRLRDKLLAARSGRSVPQAK